MKVSIAERLFNQEVKDKKRTASGVHSKKGKRGYVGKVRYTADILSGKAKREYQKNGKVEVWNMYDKIMDYDKFKSLPQTTQKSVLENLRDKFASEEIKEKWGIKHHHYYELLNELGIEKRQSKWKRKRISDDELIEAAKVLIAYEKFKELEFDQQHFLLTKYTMSMSADELARIWELKTATIYSLKHTLKKKVKAGEFEPINLPVYEPVKKVEKGVKDEPATKTRNNKTEYAAIENNTEVDEPKMEKIPDTVISSMEDNKVESNPMDNEPINQSAPETTNHAESNVTEQQAEPVEKKTRYYGTKLTFDGEANKEQLKRKMNALLELLESGDERFYKFEVCFTEIEE